MERLVPSVLRVVVFNGDQLVALGTGVIVGQGDGGVYVATNYHVIANGSANGIRVLAPARRSAGGEDDEGRPQVIEREAEYRRSDTGRGKDIAILFVPGLSRPPVTFLDGTLNPDAEVRALGYPYTDLALWRRIQPRPWITDGRVSALERESITAGGSAVDQIVHTADLNEGMSGGPLVDHCGRLVGLNAAFLNGATGRTLPSASPTSAGWPVSWVPRSRQTPAPAVPSLPCRHRDLLSPRPKRTASLFRVFRVGSCRSAWPLVSCWLALPAFSYSCARGVMAPGPRLRAHPVCFLSG
jgi:S1-C subfamily serine protease